MCFRQLISMLGFAFLVSFVAPTIGYAQCDAKKPYTPVYVGNAPTLYLGSQVPIRELPSAKSFVESKNAKTLLQQIPGTCTPKKIFADCSLLRVTRAKKTLSMSATDPSTNPPTTLVAPLKVRPYPSAQQVDYLVSDKWTSPADPTIKDITFHIYLLDEDNASGSFGNGAPTIAKHYLVEAFEPGCAEDKPTRKKPAPPAGSINFQFLQTDVGQGHEGHN